MKRKTTKLAVIVIVSGLVLFNTAMTSAQPVYFADPDLKWVVEQKLGVSDPTADDMLALTLLDALMSGIDNLTGLEYAVNLAKLSLYNNGITDISPLSGLTNLTWLGLGHNKLSDNISPLSELTNLTTLSLGENRISDISPLSGLTNLTLLNLYNNQIIDISPLSGLDNLTTLHLSWNQLTDISPLSGLDNLTSLYLGVNQISNILPLSGLTNLTGLTLYNNQISDISPLSELTKVRYWYLWDNQISDISPLSGLTNMWELDLHSNPLNKEAYCTYLPSIIANNPNVWITYDPSPCGCPPPPALPGDFDENCRVNWGDFSIFASHWLQSPCTDPNWCGGADLDNSSQVNWGDFSIFASHWLECNGIGC